MSKSWLIPVVLALSACSTLSPEERSQSARQLAAQGGWQSQSITAGRFLLLSLHPVPTSQAVDELTVFIEGDGMAWLDAQTPSSDPTPRRPLALQLALSDPQRTVAYLGRPCQYDPAGTPQRCRVADWTQARYSAEIVAAMNVAIDHLKQTFQARRVVLIGYSGGGTIAALLATRRHDVAMLITVAGLLDHAAWTQALRISPLTGSLNPADEWAQLRQIPQIHYVGGQDRQTGRLALGPALAHPSPRVRVIEMPDFDHDCCWVEAWPRLVHP
jgi:pimeloyl-ACP methyl ester carboxylesterase